MSGFLAALGGLRANQSWIDVIGNNLANSNTPGFKSSRALFSDILSVTVRSATGPNTTTGGTNPLQIGLGVQLSSVDRQVTQGAINVTGRTFDLALLGRGHFAVNDGSQTLYTRVGSFGLDGAGNMVDVRTGFRALDPNGQTFQIDTTAVVPPSATGNVALTGNLPAEITGPLAEQLSTSTAFNEGTAAAMTGTGTGPFNIPVGETWTMELVVNGGAPEQVSIVGTGSMTTTDIANQINSQVAHATATVGANQELVLTSERSGKASTIKVNAGVTGKDLKTTLGLTDFVQGTETLATAASDLNDLSSNLVDYQAGDVIDVAGTDKDGTPVVASFTYGTDGTTVGDLATFLDGAFGQSTVTFNASTGQLEVLSDTTGEANLTLSITDGANQSGATNWSEHFFTVTADGAGPDTVNTSVEVFDTAGAAHVLSMEFTRQDDGSWTLNADVPASEGTVVNGTITGITFNANGSIQTPTSGSIDVQFGSLGTQSLALGMGTSGLFEGLTQFGNPASVIVESQDGFGAGQLASMGVTEEGVVQGFYTNGETRDLGSFGIATFGNETGLEEGSDNYLLETANSGQRVLGGGKQAGAGAVVGGSLEGSNVDTAEQFVHLIEAQRGYQANARVISVQDDLLSEIVNII